MDHRRNVIIPIIVTFNPIEEILLKNLATLIIQQQIQFIIIVDNHSTNDIINTIHFVAKQNNPKIRIIKSDCNYGLGKAFNKGISIARDLNANYVLLFDQDSVPEPDMVSKLHRAYQYFEKKGITVGAVGPRYRDPISSRLSQFVRITPLRLTRITCSKHSRNYVPTDFLISSGSLISMHALDHVGEMDDALFIDHIDTEWCFRAQSKGFALYGVCDAIMQHSLGDKQIRFWWGRWRNISFHQPFRYYYMFRNSTLLWQRPYMPAAWKRADKLRILSLLFFFTLFSPNRITNLRMMLKGLKDGSKRRTGKL